MNRTHRIADDVLAALSAAQCSGSNLVLTGTLDRKLYVKANDVLEAAGGKWNRKAKAHVFDGDAAEAIDAVIVAGEIVTKTTLQQEFGYFPTPSNIVARLLDLAAIEPGMKCLEPSAGRGAIATPLAVAGARVDVVELLEDNCHALGSLGNFHSVRQADFLTLEVEPTYDRIVMNPPFSMQADIKHVTHALQFLKSGGALVSVMSAGVMWRQDRRATAFRKLLEGSSEYSIEPLPENSFKESGTGVNTVVVRARVAA